MYRKANDYYEFYTSIKNLSLGDFFVIKEFPYLILKVLHKLPAFIVATDKHGFIYTFTYFSRTDPFSPADMSIHSGVLDDYCTRLVKKKEVATVNKINIIGRLTRDPETFSGKKSPDKMLTTFTLALSDGQDKSILIPMIAFDRVGKNISTFCSKGSLVGITGKLTSRVIEKENYRYSVVEVIVETIDFLEPKESTSKNTMDELPF